MLRSSCYKGTFCYGFPRETRQDLLVEGKFLLDATPWGDACSSSGEAEKAVRGKHQSQLDKCITLLFTLSCDQDSMRKRTFPQAGKRVAYAYWDQRPYTSPPLPKPVAALPGETVFMWGRLKVNLIKLKQLWVYKTNFLWEL